MNDKILELEKSLFKVNYIKNLDYLNKIIDDNYKELGKSGILFNKNQVIKDLLKIKEDRKIIIYNYSCDEISRNIYLVHYITKSNRKYFYRSSIWKNKNEEFKILYHQATEYKGSKILKQF